MPRLMELMLSIHRMYPLHAFKCKRVALKRVALKRVALKRVALKRVSLSVVAV